MANPRDLSVLMTVLVMGLLAWHLLGDRRRPDPAHDPGRQRRFRLGWEVRALVVAVTGPYAAGICLGYVSADYALPLALFVVAGLLVAQRIGPSGLRDR